MKEEEQDAEVRETDKLGCSRGQGNDDGGGDVEEGRREAMMGVDCPWAGPGRPRLILLALALALLYEGWARPGPGQGQPWPSLYLEINFIKHKNIFNK